MESNKVQNFYEGQLRPGMKFRSACMFGSEYRGPKETWIVVEYIPPVNSEVARLPGRIIAVEHKYLNFQFTWTEQNFRKSMTPIGEVAV